MATVTERISSRGTGKDRNNKRLGTRVFIVDLPPDAVNQNPPPGLPIPGFDTFPTDPTLICDNIRADYLDGSTNHSEVRAEYTNDRSGTFGGGAPLDPTAPGFRSWSVDWRVVQTEIPYWVKSPARYSWSNPANQTETFITGYEIEQFATREVFETIVRRSVVESFVTADYEKIGSQVNTLHQIGSRVYLYSSGSVEETSPGKWKVEHVWEYDPGTPNNFRPSGPEVGWPQALTSIIPIVSPGVQFARPPYHGVVPTPGIYDPGPPPFVGPPRFAAVPLYAAPTPFGWQTLPGMP
jgi:hypothetical protein